MIIKEKDNQTKQKIMIIILLRKPFTKYNANLQEPIHKTLVNQLQEVIPKPFAGDYKNL